MAGDAVRGAIGGECGKTLLAKKLYGVVMIIQKNARTHAHPRPPA